MQPTSDRDSGKLFLEVLHLKAASHKIVKHLIHTGRKYRPHTCMQALRLACSAGRAAVDSAISRVGPYPSHPDASILLTANWDVRHFTLYSSFWPRDALIPFLHHQKRLETLVLNRWMHVEFVDALMKTQLPALTNLELEEIAWESAASKPFSAVPFLSQLRRLKMIASDYSDLPYVRLPDFLPNCTSLEVLDYWKDDLTSSCDVFSDIIRVSLPRLREFGYYTMFKEYSENLRQNLSGVSVANTWPSLTKLSLKNYYVAEQNRQTTLEYMNCFADVDGINEFSISHRNYCTINMSEVLNIPWCANLTSLHIIGGELMDDDAGSCFAKVDWKNLQRLKFSGGYMRGIGFANVNMPSLRYFNLEGVGIKHESGLFSIPVCDQLTRLKLGTPFNFSAEDVEQQEKAFSNFFQNRNLNNLEDLEIDHSIRLKTAVAMANVGYGKMPALRRLHVQIFERFFERFDCRDVRLDKYNDGVAMFFLGVLNGSLPRQVVTPEDFIKNFTALSHRN